MKLTTKEIAALFDCSVERDLPITGIEFDSRKIQPGNLFVPLAGQRDGHEFAEQARAKGAIISFWSSKSLVPPEQLTVISVADTKEALQKLARYYRGKINPKVVAITGSNGKTTTKDMTEAVLAQKYNTYKTQGNYNNEIGLPYTILHMPDTTEALVLEMGMDHAGDLTLLSEIGQPDVAAITLIGEAHIESLGSRDKIAQGKMEITKGLKKEGRLFIPADEPLLKPLTEKISQKVVTFGLEQGNIAGVITEKKPTHTKFSIGTHSFVLPVLGNYNVKNALIAYGIGRLFGETASQIASGLATFHLTENRGQWLKAFNGADLFSDVYNANPTATRLVLDSFSTLNLKGRKVAVLADMLELGQDSRKMHAQLACHVAQVFEEVYLYGTEMKALRDSLNNSSTKVHYFAEDQKSALIEQLRGHLLASDTVVLKGSNGMGLAEVVQALQQAE